MSKNSCLILLNDFYIVIHHAKSPSLKIYNLKVSPVPATDYILFESEKLKREIRVVDIAGQVVLHVEVNGYRE